MLASAKVGLPFTKRGITLEGMSAYILPRLVGHASERESRAAGWACLTLRLTDALEIAMTGGEQAADLRLDHH